MTSRRHPARRRIGIYLGRDDYTEEYAPGSFSFILSVRAGGFLGARLLSEISFLHSSGFVMLTRWNGSPLSDLNTRGLITSGDSNALFDAILHRSLYIRLNEP